MLKRSVEALRRLLDPRGPLGEVASPSEVYKTRLGLPVSSPQVQRVAMEAPAHLDQTLAPVRFVSVSDAVAVPADRIRQVSAFIEERWSPVYAKTESTDLATILLSSQTLIGWHVSQQQSASSRHQHTAEEFVEVAQSAQIQASDAFYNQYLETVPGNDPVIIDGEILRAQDGTVIRGGTQITHGRKEYNQKTKNFIHWDRGFIEQRNAAQAEMDSRPVRNVQRNIERVAGEVLPMRKLQHNPRYDRRSAC